MTHEHEPPTEAERREAEVLARALDGRLEDEDLLPVADALATASMIAASRRGGLSELRARAVLERTWPKRGWTRGARAAAAALAVAAAAAAVVIVATARPAALPPPPASLLRAELHAARRGAPAAVARLDGELAAYRRDMYAALGRAYGAKR
jgi:hypothetical protein